MSLLRDLTDDEARAALPLKWGTVPEDVLPLWVAEMDYALAPPVADALQRAVAAGMTGYPPFVRGGGELGRAHAGFAERHYGQAVDPEQVMPVVDVTAGVRLALEVLSEPGPVVLPLPAYDPQLRLMEVTGHERWDLPLDPDADRSTIDLDALDRLFADGARTLLLTNPHNPTGRCWTRAELEGVRDVVVRHGARVVSDEIHGPLALPGHEFVPYLSLDGTADHAVAVVATSKAFNTPGLRCGQIVTDHRPTHERLAAVPMAHNESWSPLGLVAAVAAYDDGDPWLAELVERLDAQRALLDELLPTHLPGARVRRLEATYLAWLDLRALGHDDPAAVALATGRVKVAPGHAYHPGLTGHVRLNLATSPDRLAEGVRRLGAALV
ncbi:MalY/PatB family protein [Nocardioides sp. SYSU D00038]|uniref:MalY/PatB family protein n=1 Tax=Nocardioides sp. SYSU D00038 TaxID=2812554 RepID=UPI001967A2EF|nr:aminotransferase class I/II-fold pyridoxal phosphate-dependent enzyme [Nocardioides sp. SYSU D00038]